MSITAYVGLPGSGKSYSVVKYQILPALKAGREVVTNLPVITAEIDKLALAGTVTTFDIDQLVAEPHKILEYAKRGCVFVIDEAWKIFPAGMQAADMAEPLKSLLTEHRHMVDASGNSMQIVLCVQDLANMAAFARRLVESTFVTTKLSFVGLSKSYRVDVFHGCVTGCTPNPKKALRQMTGQYGKDIYQLYKSHTMSDAGSLGANETKIDSRGNILKRPAFIIGAVLSPVLIVYSLHAFGKAFHGALGPKVAQGAAVAAPGGARSGAERAPERAAVAALGVTARLILDVMQPGGVNVGYVSDGVRMYVLSGDDCRRSTDGLQCRLRDVWYDTRGAVEGAPAQPVGAYNSALARR